MHSRFGFNCQTRHQQQHHPQQQQQHQHQHQQQPQQQQQHHQLHQQPEVDITPPPPPLLPPSTAITAYTNLLEKCRCKVQAQSPSPSSLQQQHHHHHHHQQQSQIQHPQQQPLAQHPHQLLSQHQQQLPVAAAAPTLAPLPAGQLQLQLHHHHHHHHHQTFVASASAVNYSSCTAIGSAASSAIPSSSAAAAAAASTAMYHHHHHRRHNNLSYCGVSGQEQNYQVQYVDSELYHSNSSQTQMTYPFCPVGDYQSNGQTYYSSTGATGNYTTTTGNTGNAHSTALPYLVPVDESLLLNGSSQSHSRDSPHSLTHEVAYIQEAQSTPQTPTSTTTTNSASGGSIGNGADGASPDSDQSAMGNSNKIASATIKWLSRNYETADGVSLPRSTLYNHYMQHCNEQKLEPVNAASFGKLIRSVFSGLRTRRLGTRGNSKYHYYGIRIKPGSVLIHQSMEEKSIQGYGTPPANSALVNVTSSNNSNNGNQLTSSNGSSNGITTASNAQRTVGTKKHNFKPETYEACIQYIGDGAGAMPVFPAIELSHSFHSELTLDDVDTFRALYREHCESFLDAVLNLEFGTVEFLLRDFWRTTDNNNLDECEEEKYLSKTKLYLLCHCAEVQNFVREVDYQFYQNTVDVIIPDVLRSIPNALTQAIRNFAKNLELWLCESMLGVPEQLAQIKTSAVSAFCQTLRRYTSLNHLAQAARAVLQNGAQISQMLNDLNRVDFHNVQEQAAWVSQCAPAVVQRLENDFKAALQQQSSLEQWASWLQLVVESAMEEYTGKPSYARAARQFLLKWSFYSSMIIRDLTLRSASSFGSFHLIRLLFDEYMFYLVEHKIAEAQQKTAIAVICERMKKEMDFEFECQFAYITSDGDQQQQATASTVSAVPVGASASGVSSVGGEGNDAKRLKQE
ncbi:DNA-binding protein RFX2 isoform X1 [Drosophila sulfurigaster albostrigata]|uniref:DNA-binding protein RFX2 isoform X1 n=1 Tax=Drosophila sulfurigaster albostrigata TaxID=89887 RepID=UPI002D219278|nr:DNA-binding protein RFX2 isoform X1 [Drosophila sulfurigaster albostrigata]